MSMLLHKLENALDERSFYGSCVADAEWINKHSNDLLASLHEVKEAIEEYFKTNYFEDDDKIEDVEWTMWSFRALCPSEFVPCTEWLFESMRDEFYEAYPFFEDFALEDTTEEQRNDFDEMLKKMLLEWVQKHEIKFTHFVGERSVTMTYAHILKILEENES